VLVYMSWRDQVSQGAQDDLDGLLDAVLPFGQQMLARHGEFFPYGAQVTADGQRQMVAAANDAERPASNHLLEDPYSALRESSQTTRAAAFVSDVRLGGSPLGDAMRVELEHREGVALVVLLPYRRGRPLGLKDRVQLVRRRQPVVYSSRCSAGPQTNSFGPGKRLNLASGALTRSRRGRHAATIA
jgi:hypothetical protein